MNRRRLAQQSDEEESSDSDFSSSESEEAPNHVDDTKEVWSVLPPTYKSESAHVTPDETDSPSRNRTTNKPPRGR